MNPPPFLPRGFLEALEGVALLPHPLLHQATCLSGGRFVDGGACRAQRLLDALARFKQKLPRLFPSRALQLLLSLRDPTETAVRILPGSQVAELDLERKTGGIGGDFDEFRVGQ